MGWVRGRIGGERLQWEDQGQDKWRRLRAGMALEAEQAEFTEGWGLGDGISKEGDSRGDIYGGDQ